MMIMIMCNPINFLPNLCRDKQFWIFLHSCYIFSKDPWDLTLVVDTRVPLETHQIIKCHRRDMLMSLFDQKLSSSIPSSFLVKALTQCHSYLGYPSFRLPLCPIGVPKALKAKIPETNHGQVKSSTILPKNLFIRQTADDIACLSLHNYCDSSILLPRGAGNSCIERTRVLVVPFRG